MDEEEKDFPSFDDGPGLDRLIADLNQPFGLWNPVLPVFRSRRIQSPEVVLQPLGDEEQKLEEAWFAEMRWEMEILELAIKRLRRDSEDDEGFVETAWLKAFEAIDKRHLLPQLANQVLEKLDVPPFLLE